MILGQFLCFSSHQTASKQPQMASEVKCELIIELADLNDKSSGQNHNSTSSVDKSSGHFNIPQLHLLLQPTFYHPLTCVLVPRRR